MSVMDRRCKTPFQFTLAELLAWVTAAAACLSVWLWMPSIGLLVTATAFWGLMFRIEPYVPRWMTALIVASAIIAFFLLMMMPAVR